MLNEIIDLKYWKDIVLTFCANHSVTAIETTPLGLICIVNVVFFITSSRLDNQQNTVSVVFANSVV